MTRIALIPVLLALAACTPGSNLPDVARLEEPDQIASRDASGPPDAAPGTCWGRDETPATLETVTQEVVVAPAALAADGTILTPAITRTQTTQKIVEARREIWFETPCPTAFTPDVVASLQRALSARGFYHGPINGQLDAATRGAIRKFQHPQGLNSSVLSLDAARQLGLVAIAHPASAGAEPTDR